MNYAGESHSQMKKRMLTQLCDLYQAEVRAEPSYPPNTNVGVGEYSVSLSFMLQRILQPGEK